MRDTERDLLRAMARALLADRLLAPYGQAASELKEALDAFDEDRPDLTSRTIVTLVPRRGQPEDPNV